jgi:hypothetical protein
MGAILDEKMDKIYNICIIPPNLGTRSGFLTQQVFGFISNIILNRNKGVQYSLCDKPVVVINCLVGNLTNSMICNVISAKLIGFKYIDIFNRNEDFGNPILSLQDYYNTISQYKSKISEDIDITNRTITFKTTRLKYLNSNLTNEPYYFAINAYPALFLAYNEGYTIDISAFENWYNNIKDNKNIAAFVQTAKTLQYLSKINLLGERYINALHTKPFLLLAGISGTGKSQKVQELAFMTCPSDDLRNEGGTTPGNYCLIEVKPNWHDSTELLGYYNALSGRYELTDFIRFSYKAIQHPDVPFFLCLDEMNLAPVEQYFAEYLSVLETRKRVDYTDNGEPKYRIETQPLLSKEKFANCKLEKKVLVKDNGDIIDGEKQYKMEFLYSEYDTKIIEYLQNNGLNLPDNLFVIGTVNMDDTTHQFSRKVIDRAFTIEMNGGKMSEMFKEKYNMLLNYSDDPIGLECFKPKFVRAYDILNNQHFNKYKGIISTRIPDLLGDSDGTATLDSINGILNNTEFRISYRVQNELVLYLSTLIERDGYPDDIEEQIKEATLSILMEKILPRVQGEQKQLETDNNSNILKDLKVFVENKLKPNTAHDNLYDIIIKKLNEMDNKLKGYYTNFF